MQPIPHDFFERPRPREGYPMLPARGKRWDAHEALDDAAVLYVARQVKSPWQPRTPAEIGKRGPGARRVIAAKSAINGWHVGSSHVLHHAHDGFWCGTWEIEGYVTWPGSTITGRVPEERLTLWRIVGPPNTASPIDGSVDLGADGPTDVAVSGDSMTEYAEGTGVGDFVVYRSSEGREYPALVTISPASFDEHVGGYRPEFAARDCRSLIVFRPSGSSYARHDVPRDTVAREPGARTWRPKA
jgi:hypothetical protein